jgi:hypothetical protein
MESSSRGLLASLEEETSARENFLGRNVFDRRLGGVVAHGFHRGEDFQRVGIADQDPCPFGARGRVVFGKQLAK